MIWAIGVTELRLPWVNYFDDYPILTPGEISASTMAAAKGMLKLLGFGFAENKLEPFATSAEVLGVVVDCGLVSEGKLVYAMKESRRQGLSLLVCCRRSWDGCNLRMGNWLGEQANWLWQTFDHLGCILSLVSVWTMMRELLCRC